MTRRYPCTVLAATVTLAATVLSSSAAIARERTAAPPATAAPALSWVPCGTGLHCANLGVPIDHGHPEGPSLNLAVIRRPATDPSRRLGTLVVNPGGPGASGLTFIRTRPTFFTSEIRARFDLVSFDPRGVGASGQIHCGQASYDPPGLLHIPPSQRTLDQITSAHQTYGLTCRARTGPLAEHVDTASAARDLDRLRQALELPRLTYYGVSYGTMLGVTYAQLFPDRVGRMVLDSVQDHSQPYLDNATEHARSRQAAFTALAAWANQNPATPAPRDDFTTRYQRLVRRADHKPIPAPHSNDPTPVTGADIELAVYATLAAHSRWPAITADIASAENGDASAIRDSLSSVSNLDALASVRTIACSDFPTPPLTAADLRRLTDRLIAISPTQARGVITDQLRCRGWPLPLRNPPDPAPAPVQSRVLILATTVDPITPFPAAVRAQRLIPGSTLLAHTGVGHGVYGASAHLTRVVDDYLLCRRPDRPATANGQAAADCG